MTVKTTTSPTASFASLSSSLGVCAEQLIGLYKQNHHCGGATSVYYNEQLYSVYNQYQHCGEWITINAYVKNLFECWDGCKNEEGQRKIFEINANRYKITNGNTTLYLDDKILHQLKYHPEKVNQAFLEELSNFL